MPKNTFPSDAPFPTPDKGCADIAMVGLAVMGRNFALNLADHSHAVAVYNRTTSKTHDALAEVPPNCPGSFIPCQTLEDLVRALKKPRIVVTLVAAGKGTDAIIDQLIPLLSDGDCIVDGGNAHYDDTARRAATLKEHNLHFVGSGVSGGEEGARFGPSLMPGGSKKGYKLIKSFWEDVAAKVDADTGKPLEGAAPGKPVVGGVPCTAFVGEGGAGHFVKMVHNGIEYADMQLIAETYHFMRDALAMTPSQMSEVFRDWNTGPLDSFLTEITADILDQQDPRTKQPFVDIVLDSAGQKGTGKWTAVNALELGVSAPSITEAVFARFISSIKGERVAAADILPAPEHAPLDKDDWLDPLRDALYCSKICAYAQGFALITSMSAQREWNIDLASLASIWRGGCIIRARFLQHITDAFNANSTLANLMLDPFFSSAIASAQHNWRRVIAHAATVGIPVPAFASSLAYYDSYRTADLPANLIQAQRDYFGAHTYERTDAPRGQFFHLDWPDPNRPELTIS